jgi:hypothetical protein
MRCDRSPRKRNRGALVGSLIFFMATPAKFARPRPGPERLQLSGFVGSRPVPMEPRFHELAHCHKYWGLAPFELFYLRDKARFLWGTYAPRFDCWRMLNLRMAIPLDPIQKHRMGEGRLIRVCRYRGDPRAKAYLIAVSDKTEAMRLIASKAASAADEIEDLGRVSEALITAMALTAGEFIPIDGIRHVSQQQQQPHSKTEGVT